MRSGILGVRGGGGGGAGVGGEFRNSGVEFFLFLGFFFKPNLLTVLLQFANICIIIYFLPSAEEERCSK